MKKLLIISPYFPPTNAADMQRVRMSLSYFAEFGWQAEVVVVNAAFSDMGIDEMLLLSLPSDTVVHTVAALPKKWTSRVGLGSIALRSLWYYRQKVNQLLKNSRYDLIYFSTTQFPVCTLGSYWKRKFGIPYVIDMQDPWFNDYYVGKPKNERPPKFWFAYRLNKLLEPIAMRSADGLISVSEAYISTLKRRYPNLEKVPSLVITFGAFKKDRQIVQQHLKELPIAFKPAPGIKNLVYIGRGGKDMQPALSLLFQAFKQGLESEPDLFSGFRFHFVGTSYAPRGKGIPTITPVAELYNVKKYVTEQTDRIPFYQGLASLEKADGLIIPGSDDSQYTASKLYPYILAEKPLLGIFHSLSSAIHILNDCNAGYIVTLDTAAQVVFEQVKSFLKMAATGEKPVINFKAFEPYTALEMTRKQCSLFNEVIGLV